MKKFIKQIKNNWQARKIKKNCDGFRRYVFFLVKECQSSLIHVDLTVPRKEKENLKWRISVNVDLTHPKISSEAWKRAHTRQKTIPKKEFRKTKFKLQK